MTAPLTCGSLFTGYGGLDLGVARVPQQAAAALAHLVGAR